MTGGSEVDRERAFVEGLSGKRIGVALSAGFFGFFGHAGFLGALETLGIGPSAFAGTSAGALVAAMRAGGLSAREIEARLLGLRREDFWDRGRSWHLLRSALRGFSGWSGYLSGERLRRELSNALPVQRFEDTELPLYVATTNVSRSERRLWDRGSLVDAVHASCAYPFLFENVMLDGERHMDGGLVDKIPIEELVTRERVDVLLIHWLRSQSKPYSGSALGGIKRGVDASREELARWKLSWAEAVGVDVYVFAPTLPRVGPKTVATEGPRALEAARDETRRIIREGAFLRVGDSAWRGRR